MIRPIRSLGLAKKKQPVQTFTSFRKNTRFNLETLEDRTAPAVAITYVNEAWSGLAMGSLIADADPNDTGNQSAVIGTNAFAGLDAGVSAVQSGGKVNLWSGTYPQNVALNVPFSLSVLEGTATVSGVLSGPQGLTVGIPSGQAMGTLALTGANTYLGNTSVVRGSLQISNDNQLGNPSGSVTITTPGDLQISGNVTSRRKFTMNISAKLQVAKGMTLALDGAVVDGGTLVGPDTIATIGLAPTTFNGGASFGVTINANTDANFTGFSNGGILDVAATRAITLSSFTNTSAGRIFVNGTANVSDFSTMNEITVAPTGKLVNVGASGLIFGGGSLTIVKRLGPLDNIDDGFIDLGTANATLTAGLMINHGIVGSVTPGVSLVVNSDHFGVPLRDYPGKATGPGLYTSVWTTDGGIYSPGGGTQSNEAVFSGDTTGTVQKNTIFVATGALTVTDPDPGELGFQAAAGLTSFGSYAVTADGHWVYTLNNDSPAVQAFNGGQFTDSFTVLSFDGTTQVVMISIKGLNPAPVFTQSSYSMTFDLTAALQIIGSVHADDTNFQVATYAITAGNDIGLFSINASTGTITFKGQDCCGTVNFDQDFNLTVSATDNGDPIMSSTATVSVKRRSR